MRTNSSMSCLIATFTDQMCDFVSDNTRLTGTCSRHQARSGDEFDGLLLSGVQTHRVAQSVNTGVWIVAESLAGGIAHRDAPEKSATDGMEADVYATGLRFSRGKSKNVFCIIYFENNSSSE